jgi:glyoxylase-like metal-dependent hydrolase (beta-lactamase superfamily II)
VVKEESTIELFPNSIIEIWETPGHNEGCLTYKIEKAIFTGDTLIPGVKVVTKLKSGNKLQALQSIQKIKVNSNPDDIIFPGHGSSVLNSDLDLDFYLK